MARDGEWNTLAESMRRKRSALGIVMMALVVLSGPGCSYKSTYVAPKDGRARLVWTGTDVAPDLGGVSPSRECLSLAGFGVDEERPGGPAPGRRGQWSPRFYGPPIVLLSPGMAPVWGTGPARPIFGPVFPGPLSPGVLVLPRASFFVGIWSLRGVDGKAAAALAVLLVASLSIVDFALALDEPESRRSVAAMDRVNAYNDWARTPGSPCWIEEWPENDYPEQSDEEEDPGHGGVSMPEGGGAQ